MKNLLFLFVSLFFIACSNNPKEGAQENIDNQDAVHNHNSQEVTIDVANAPIVEVESDTYLFGEVDEGEKVTHEYAFINAGTTPLIINSVQASCGCTTPSYPKQPIKPGEEAKILVVFDTNNQPGMQHKVITMTSNAQPSQTIFHLKGEVK